MTTVNPADISLRPARDGDEPFLKRVHDTARHWEFASLLQDGESELYHKVMAQQYDSQHRFYFANYETAHYGIIQWTGQPVGRLYVDYRDDEVRVLESCSPRPRSRAERSSRQSPPTPRSGDPLLMRFLWRRARSTWRKISQTSLRNISSR
jgi:hypothetical protein